MTVLTEAAFLALAMQCAPGIAPGTLLAVARVESGLNPVAQNVNKDGSRDIGLMQINERNFGWLGLTSHTALDPCQSLRAAGQLLQSYSRYNTGSPVNGFGNGYVQKVMASTTRMPAASPPVTRSITAEDQALTFSRD
jgi:type IV secretion system protein VirB1